MGSLKNYRVLMGLATLALCAISTFVVAAPPHIDPCTLLTHAEVEHVMGQRQGNPKADKEGQAAWCTCEFASGKEKVFQALIMTPATPADKGSR